MSDFECLPKPAIELGSTQAEVERLQKENKELKDKCEVLQEKLDAYQLYGS